MDNVQFHALTGSFQDFIYDSRIGSFFELDLNVSYLSKYPQFVQNENNRVLL